MISLSTNELLIMEIASGRKGARASLYPMIEIGAIRTILIDLFERQAGAATIRESMQAMPTDVLHIALRRPQRQ